MRMHCLEQKQNKQNGTNVVIANNVLFVCGFNAPELGLYEADYALYGDTTKKIRYINDTGGM